jgi:hypothetical protein
VLCSQCATVLPEGSQFCLKCGQAVPASTAPAVEPARTRATPPPKRRAGRRPGIAIWILGAALLGSILWVATSNHPFAQQLREYAGSHNEAVGPTAFSVKPRSFTFYKFTVPAGATNVILSGQFTASGSLENDVEVYVLNDDDFVTLRSGYSANNYYDSGRVAQSDINAALPFGGGAYYLVFDNRFSPRTPKTIHAAVTLHYNNWWPEILLRLREKILTALNW